VTYKTSIPKLHSIKWKNGGMAGNVEVMSGVAYEPLPDDVLKGAYEADLIDVVVVGYTRDGNEYIAGTPVDISRAHFMFSRGALAMLRVAD
jgi:hypothetical protein